MTENADHQKDPFLYEAALALSAKLAADDVLQCLNDLVDEFLLPEAVSVALARPDGSLIFRAASGKNAEQIVGMEMARGSGIVGWVAEHGDAVWVPNVYDDQRFYRGTDKKTGFKTTAILAVPVEWEDTILAVVEVINPAPGTDVRDAQEMLAILAALAAQALQNAQRFEATSQSIARYQCLLNMHEQLSSQMAHDLRVPLGNIVNAMDMVLAAWREDDHTIPVEDVLGIGLRSAQRMLLLISNLRDVGRLVTDPTLSLSTIYLSDMVTEVAEAIRPAAERHNQSLRRRLPDDSPPLQADVDRVRRVLINLIDNAIRHTPDGGTITLSIHVDEREFLFSVSDTGPGIPPEAQARLFEPFPPPPGQELDKVGLGLVFCKLAVEAHGGEIGVQSGNGQGTVFYFTIPRQLPENTTTLES